jgi:hypothetical protein
VTADPHGAPVLRRIPVNSGTAKVSERALRGGAALAASFNNDRYFDACCSGGGAV